MNKRENFRCVNGIIVRTARNESVYKNTALEAEAGTTGFRGGERDRGGRTYLRLKNLGGVDIHFNPLNDGVEIVTSGDSSLVALLESLLFALDTMTDKVVSTAPQGGKRNA